LVGGFVGIGEAAEGDGEVGGIERRNFFNRNFGGFIYGEAVGAGADRGESDGFKVVFFCKGEGGAVTAGELFGFAVSAAVPDGADGVDDVFSGEVVALGDFRVAGLAATEGFTFFKELRASSAMDGAIDSASAEEGCVGGVNDSINFEGSDISSNDFWGRHGDLFLKGFLGFIASILHNDEQ